MQVFFRPSPSRLSPGRNTVFVPIERIVQRLASSPLWECQKRAWTHTQSRYCPYAMATTQRKTQRTNKKNTKTQNQQPGKNHIFAKDTSSALCKLCCTKDTVVLGSFQQAGQAKLLRHFLLILQGRPQLRHQKSYQFQVQKTNPKTSLLYLLVLIMTIFPFLLC